MLVPVLMYGSETMLWKEQARSRFRAGQVDNLRGLLAIRRIGRIPNARIRKFCGVKKRQNIRIDEDLLWWFDHVETDRIAMRVYVGECVGSDSMGTPRKR